MESYLNEILYSEKKGLEKSLKREVLKQFCILWALLSVVGTFFSSLISKTLSLNKIINNNNNKA